MQGGKAYCKLQHFVSNPKTIHADFDCFERNAWWPFSKEQNALPRLPSIKDNIQTELISSVAEDWRNVYIMGVTQT